MNAVKHIYNPGALYKKTKTLNPISFQECSGLARLILTHAIFKTK